MARGQTRKGRYRAGLLSAVTSARPLLKARDHGEPVSVRGRDIGAAGERWVEPFLAANSAALKRLDLRHEVRADPEVRVLLRPGAKIGAIPLLGPATRRVVAGFLVEPRFQWPALGAVFSAIGFSVEPRMGGALLVPGSAREVPPWLLAGPVLERLAALLRHRRRGFVARREVRASPRGQIEWNTWASSNLPQGLWTMFPCCFSEPDHDPALMASVRWTLTRLREELSAVPWSPPARHLLERAALLETEVGPGKRQRPAAYFPMAGASEWVVSASEAMSWVAEERGLGGARSLDGLAWDLAIDAVWEAWVAAFSAQLGRRLGMVASPYQAARRALHWRGPHQSMGALVPDVELRDANHVVWLDAKYKAHLELLARHGWTGLSTDVRAEHRADLHQALAYAALADVERVDSLLVYPQLAHDQRSLVTIATVTSGRRCVRVILAAIPFGYRNPDQEAKCLGTFREILAA